MELTDVTLTAYAEQALADVRRSLGRFDDTTVNLRPHGPTTNSAAALIVHACTAAKYWFGHIGLGQAMPRDREAEFDASATIAELNVVLDDTARQLRTLINDFVAGPTAADHELRVFSPGGDTSDGSVALHALQELFQHLGHLELTADALTNPS